MSHHKPDPNRSVNLTIDGIPVTVPEGTRILEAAKKVNVHIPTLCDHPDLCKRAVCRLCVVECDGRGKLLAACANDVWEGVSVVTNNSRLSSIRKMIIELILANHPQECLTCIRNKNCELQSLAASFGIRETAFSHNPADRRPPVTENKTLVRDIGKCVKCGRCVEACQEVQTVRAINTAYRSGRYEISAPYGQSLADGPCVFCGHCAEVCPVGAIFEYDQTAEMWAALNDKDCYVTARIAPGLETALNNALGLPANTVTAGKMVTALKRLGFGKVVDARVFAAVSAAQCQKELRDRMRNGGKLPMITVSSPGLVNFVKGSYPELASNLAAAKSPRQLFAEWSASASSAARTACISIVPSLAEKFNPQTAAVDPALTVQEFARVIRLAGVDFTALPETPFDAVEAAGETGDAGETAPVLVANTLPEARVMLDSVRKGECDAAMVEIKSCR